MSDAKPKFGSSQPFPRLAVTEPSGTASDEIGADVPPPGRRRSKQKIKAAFDEVYDRVWWVRHQVAKEQGRVETWLPEKCEQAFARAAEIEQKYGVESLELSDVDWGILNGKRSALRWLLGASWDGATPELNRCRLVPEIMEAMREFYDRVWRERIVALMEDGDADAWPGEVKYAVAANVERIDREWGPEREYDDEFAWGALHGKLSTLRWSVGDEWDALDTGPLHRELRGTVV